MDPPEITVVLSLRDGSAGEEDEALEDLALDLQSELMEYGVASTLARSASAVPPDARADGLVVAGALVAAVPATAAAIEAVTGLVRGWMERRHVKGTMEITIAGDSIYLSSADPDERAALIDAWIARHISRPSQPHP